MARCYATIYQGETDKLRNQQGKKVPPVPITIRTETEPEVANPEDSESSSNDSNVVAEKADLLAYLQECINEKRLGEVRVAEKQKAIDAALTDKNPIDALRLLALQQPNFNMPKSLRSKAAHAFPGVAREKLERWRTLTRQGSAKRLAADANQIAEMDGIVEQPHLLDHAQITATRPLPTKEDYSDIPDGLRLMERDRKHTSEVLRQRCEALKLRTEINTSYSVNKLEKSRKQKLGTTRIVSTSCTLELDVADLCRETAVGEGWNKVQARQAAWLSMFSTLWESGVLNDLFPRLRKVTPAVQPKEHLKPDEFEDPKARVMSESHHTEAATLEPTQIDPDTLAKEIDAKSEIYNWAAGLGLIPHFTVRSRSSRVKQVGRAQKKPTVYLQVGITIPELAIDVSALGKDMKTAEIAAALAFKQKAEERQLASNSREVHSGFSMLNINTAKQFFDFCKDSGEGVSLEFEHEVFELSGYNVMTVTANGEPVGQEVSMRTKKEAQAIAYLTAAVDISKQQPRLLQAFEQAMRKSKGKPLKPVSSVDIELRYPASKAMRHALLQAQNAGLSESKEMLQAESLESEQILERHRSRRRERQLGSANGRLQQWQAEFDKKKSLLELRERKAALPMNQFAHPLIDMVSHSTYSIVVGATGSGKTTQVPQILFENAVRECKGANCNIICTQPRRIAATSVARRVAEERNESLQKTVGYHVRLERRLPRFPYGITYCTTGILLERLKYDLDNVLETTSHILIDEVHERDLDIDFLMIVLKKAVSPRRKEKKTVPKIIMMSATLDTELFANYFSETDGRGQVQPAPCLSVPGQTFAVKEQYLGSFLHEMLRVHGPKVLTLIEAPNANEQNAVAYLKSERDFSANHYSSGQHEPREDAIIDWKRERTPASESEQSELTAAEQQEEGLVPTRLLAVTIAHICSTTTDGAILAFLPGLAEILATEKILQDIKIFGMDFNDKSKFKICHLHSAVPYEQQSEVFESTAPGCRKIILSTNIAETSVTVTDVKFVIDTGKHRENRYDQIRRITKLQTVWISKSNSRQRMGRAGRVSDGSYIALFSKERADALRAVGLPELLRSDLSETCLDIKARRFDEPVSTFLAQALEPPPIVAVDVAVKNLKSIEAYTQEEELTALGRVLSRLPVHPALGKMVILGVIFKCLDPMIALGAADQERALFSTPITNRADAIRAHHSYASKAQSDHLAFLEAFAELRQLKLDHGEGAVRSRAREQFLHYGAFNSIDQTSKQIVEVLTASGLISPKAITTGSTYGPDRMNTNAHNKVLVKCLLLAGSHPNLATKLCTHGVTYRHPTEANVLIANASRNAEMRLAKESRHVQSTLFTFSQLARSVDGKTLFMRDTTRVTALMAVLFGGKLEITDHGRVEMDDWLPFFVKGADRQFSTNLIMEFRKALDRVLNRAYASLADLDSGNFGNDPVVEQFTKMVVEVLGAEATVARQQDGWGSWPSQSDGARNAIEAFR